MLTCPDPHAQEFRDDVVALARCGDGPLPQVVKDSGISESCAQLTPPR
jgi:transposase